MQLGGLITLVFVLVSFIALVVWIVRLARKGQAKSDLEVQQFAQSSGFTFNPKPNKQEVFDLSIFRHPHNLTLRQQVTMTNGRVVVMCYASDGAGQNQHMIPYLVSITKISDNNTCFNLYAKSLNGIFVFSDKDLSKYQLEGQLSELYDFYVKQGTETEALTILQPDTLLNLVNSSPSTAVIARPGYIYVFLRRDAAYAQLGMQSGYSQLFTELNRITDSLLKVNMATASTNTSNIITTESVVPVQPSLTPVPNRNNVPHNHNAEIITPQAVTQSTNDSPV